MVVFPSNVVSGKPGDSSSRAPDSVSLEERGRHLLAPALGHGPSLTWPSLDAPCFLDGHSEASNQPVSTRSSYLSDIIRDRWSPSIS